MQQQHSTTITTTATTTSLYSSNSNWIDHIDSQLLLAVGDYATEIENSVGSEIYSPIFKAGLFIFISGLVSAFLAAFIVSKADSWDGLEEEFQLGKESQFIDNTVSAQELYDDNIRMNEKITKRNDNLYNINKNKSDDDNGKSSSEISQLESSLNDTTLEDLKDLDI